ncbi:MAG: glucosidase [Bacillati bacterium ANGP1]|uniref:Glucosidase n=1 Tax=Candidatus Segetimicrobium genomatis TaxID=2569760 RepID=A0A537J2A9_9BACT|nr:MAG: glucosidase [Terrabacteria group bacterium ANGP1]
MGPAGLDAERRRIADAREQGAPWSLWGPYLSEREWGTVREDYSPDGAAWDYFPHDHARSRAYRWGEDGLLGICDDHGLLCFALALRNEADPILKERLFGLSGAEGNHGEDVKEYYFFLDCTPSHSYMKALYKYPQRAFPYAGLVAENRRRGRSEPEYELIDTGAFAENRYFDVVAEYAKSGPDDILIRITATNRGPESAPLRLLPTLWFRNTWAWGYDDRRPELRAVEVPSGPRGDGAFRLLRATHRRLGDYWLACGGEPELLFTENETNAQRLWGLGNRTLVVKDGIHDAVVGGRRQAVNAEGVGTKAAAHYAFRVAAGAAERVELRLSSRRQERPFTDTEAVFTARRAEADAFYQRFGPAEMSEDARRVQRQAFAGLLWSKQYYHYTVEEWLDGDPAGPPPPESRKLGRNTDWRHLDNSEVISMPDTWEFPWYAAWDLAFHCIPLALIDPEFAKSQLILLLREWYMHPNGQLPAYEWALGDVNPPVHAWAAWRVYKIARRITGTADHAFLERVFHKLLLNFTWWVNRKDIEGRNVFQGGFLGLDNVGVFDRSQPLPAGGHLDQADGTAWMGMFCNNMLAIALELARVDRAYEDVATKFVEHFLYIAGALNNIGGEGIAMWDDQDEFYYDVLHADGEQRRLQVRSVVGAIPLFAVETIEPDLLEALPDFRERLESFLAHKPRLAGLVSRWREPGMGERRLFALARGHRMKRVLRRLLDPAEFLSDFGIRSLSRYHADHPYTLQVGGATHTVAYEPGVSSTGLFGGNSNWRGPVWFPVNFLIIEALQRFHHYYGDDFLVECPTGSGTRLTLWEISQELSRRLTRIFLRGPGGRRPVFGASEVFNGDPHWRDCLLFHEYFHGDTGAGLGASHQTGWTALVAKLLEQTGGR